MPKTTVTLPSGQEMPLIGLGTYAAKTDGEVQAAVFSALKSGYRHIDGALLYGNEKEVGQGIHNAIKELGIKRLEKADGVCRLVELTDSFTPLHSDPRSS